MWSNEVSYLKRLYPGTDAEGNSYAVTPDIIVSTEVVSVGDGWPGVVVLKVCVRRAALGLELDHSGPPPWEGDIYLTIKTNGMCVTVTPVDPDREIHNVD